jgi:hypothetical protein
MRSTATEPQGYAALPTDQQTNYRFVYTVYKDTLQAYRDEQSKFREVARWIEKTVEKGLKQLHCHPMNP